MKVYIIFLLFAIVAISCSKSVARKKIVKHTVKEVHITVKNDGTLDPIWFHKNGIYIDRQSNKSHWNMFTTPKNLFKLKKVNIPYHTVNHTVVHHNEAKIVGGYHSYDELVELFTSVAESFPLIVRKFSIGTTIHGREIVGVRITDFANTAPKPKFKWIGNMHGDETVGRELLIRLVVDMTAKYKKDPAITSLIENTDIYIVPSMNPDGFAYKRRTNANGVDLNRNFPDKFVQNGAHLQPETKAVMKWSLANKFTLSANLHGGDLVVNYPLDGNVQHRSGIYSSSNDDTLFKVLAKTYSKAHLTMKTQSTFSDGITNGARWYILYGGMQDWNYFNTDDVELTMELSKVKFPSATQLDDFWKNNKPALYAYMKNIHIGFKGKITDKQTGKVIKDAKIHTSRTEKRQPVTIQRKDITSGVDGMYYKLLEKGKFTLTVSAPGYKPQSFIEVESGVGKATILNVALVKSK